MKYLLAAASGLLFGIGLTVSGMVNPAKVKNFLDVAGTWDPSLALVMAGAIFVTLPGYAILKKTPKPWFAPAFQWPTRQDIDGPLLSGAVMFGVGWALSGLCPGPALAALPTAIPGVIGFGATMVLGMLIANHQKRVRDEPLAAS